MLALNINHIGAIGGGGGSIPSSIYPQDRPTLADPVTVAEDETSLAGSIYTADITVESDVKKEVVLSGVWPDGMVIDGIKGANGADIIFTNEDGSTFLGADDKIAHAIGQLNSPNHIWIHGKDKDTPLRMSAGSGQSGIVVPPIATANGGSVYRIYNVGIEDVGYTGILASIGSGSAHYKKLVVCWSRTDGLVTEGEVEYYGNVSTESRFDKIISLHNRGRNKGREGFQVKWAVDFVAYNNTYRNVGQVSDTAQQHGFQWEVSNGVMYDMIFDGCKRPFNIFAHGCTLDGGFTRYTGDKGYIGNAGSFWPAHARLNNVKILIKNHTFIKDSEGTDYLAQWAEEGCDIEFLNCVFSDNISSGILEDIRSGGSNSIIGTTTTNGNTSVPLATLLTQLPTYKSDDITDKDFNYIVNGTAWFNAGVGAGSPSQRALEILEAVEDTDDSVEYGTVFGSISLPSTGRFLISNGQYVTLPIVWAEGSYDEETADDYVLEATPTLTGTDYVNTAGIKVQKNVTVEEEVTGNQVLINLGGTSSAYVGTGNWNHVFQSFATGAQTIKGDNTGETLASFRKTDGTLTGYGLSITTQFEGNSLGQNSAGTYPAAANAGNWSNPGSAGTSRVFTLTGLDPGTEYSLKILGSAADFLSGSSHLVTVQVSGGSGGGTLSNQEIEANTSTTMDFTVTPTGGGVVTITVTKTSTGQAYINVIDLEWT